MSKMKTIMPNTRNRLFYINHEKHPNPINVTTFQTTSAFADTCSYHPYHVRTARRLDQFDPTKLHWSVFAPFDLSRSALVRKTAARRVREAFRQELRLQGWDSEGRRTPEGGPDGQVRSHDLSGAVKLGLVKEAFAVTATSEEVRQSAGWAVKTIVATHNMQRKDNNPQHKRGGHNNERRNLPKGQQPGTAAPGPVFRRISHR